jgi:putative restriction endonuclease
VNVDLLQEATDDGWAIGEPRRTKNDLEVRAVIHPSHLHRFLKASIEADRRSLTGNDRAAFLSMRAPELEGLDIAGKISDAASVSLAEIERLRIAITATRLKRAVYFSQMVLAEFQHRCAICEIQLSVLEGAHIIPVHDPKGADEVWNGLALCPTHHRLFDRRIILIDSNAVVRVDDDTLAVLRNLGRVGGYDQVIGVYRNKVLSNLPSFFQVDRAKTKLMKEALRLNYNMSPTT